MGHGSAQLGLSLRRFKGRRVRAPPPESLVHAPPVELEARPGAVIACPPGFHIAFDAVYVHAAALAAGGLDNGPSGAAPRLRAADYAAFLFDPDGWRIEAATYNTA